MQFTRSDLADLSYFLAIAKHRNFRRAGLELGVSASALSHSLRGLEERLNIRLLNRTNRSVTLTAAGEELKEAISLPFDEIGQAIEKLNRFRDAPTGRIRLNVLGDAGTLLLGPVLPVFVERYPGIEVEVAATNKMVDVTDGGFDAGIRYGGTVPEDMIAQRLSGEIRWIVVGAPSYLEKVGVPDTPDDLARHQCLRIRLGNDEVYRWEFMRDSEEFSVAVPGSILFDETQIGLAMVRAGAGLMYAAEPIFAPLIASGAVRPVLERWWTVGPGFHMYYSSRRQVPSGLRLLIELIRELRPLGL